MTDLELTARQAADELGVSERTIRDWLQNGRLRGRQVDGRRGKEWRVLTESLSNTKQDDAADAAEGGERGAAQAAGDGGEYSEDYATLLSELSSLRQEHAASRKQLERLTAVIMALEDRMERLLSPRPLDPESEARQAEWLQRRQALDDWRALPWWRRVLTSRPQMHDRRR
jgi:excisionase family DNA binding protein